MYGSGLPLFSPSILDHATHSVNRHSHSGAGSANAYPKHALASWPSTGWTSADVQAMTASDLPKLCNALPSRAVVLPSLLLGPSCHFLCNFGVVQASPSLLGTASARCWEVGRYSTGPPQTRSSQPRLPYNQPQIGPSPPPLRSNQTQIGLAARGVREFWGADRIRPTRPEFGHHSSDPDRANPNPVRWVWTPPKVGRRWAETRIWSNPHEIVRILLRFGRCSPTDGRTSPDSCRRCEIGCQARRIQECCKRRSNYGWTRRRELAESLQPVPVA